MATVSLTIDGITFTFNDGDVDDCKELIQSNIEVSLLTGMGPMGVYLYDYEGCVKTIEVSGVLTEADTTRTSSGTIKTVLEQKKWLESLLNGIQKPITITSNYATKSVSTSTGASSPYQGTFVDTKVKVESMTFTEKGGNPLQLIFRMSFKVGQ